MEQLNLFQTILYTAWLMLELPVDDKLQKSSCFYILLDNVDLEVLNPVEARQ